MHYLKDPDAIYARSFAIIGEEVDLSGLSAPSRPIALRLIHASGMADILSDLSISDSLAPAVSTALGGRRPLIVDCEMLRSAIIARNLPPGTEIVCTLNHPDAAARGRTLGITRSAAAVALWQPHLDGAVVAIGNAPTALFALLEAIDAGAP